jgi:hypothetical protein
VLTNSSFVPQDSAQEKPNESTDNGTAGRTGR